MNLSSWKLQYRSASGSGAYQTMVTLPAMTSIPSHGFLLIGSGGTGGYSGTADVVRTNMSGAGSALGGADASAGNNFDSDDNGSDFVIRATRDPQNRNSATEP